MAGSQNAPITYSTKAFIVSPLDWNDAWAWFTDAINILDDDVTIVDDFAVNGETFLKDKLYFTQEDGNEYIDSLDDGYLDLVATTGIRFTSPLTSITGNLDLSGNIDLNGNNFIDVGIIYGGTVSAAENYVRIGDAGTTNHSLDSEDDLMVTGELEVKSNLYVDGNIHSSGMKSGTDQADAGAVAGELYFDTNDDNTVKMGI